MMKKLKTKPKVLMKGTVGLVVQKEKTQGKEKAIR